MPLAMPLALCKSEHSKQIKMSLEKPSQCPLALSFLFMVVAPNIAKRFNGV